MTDKSGATSPIVLYKLLQGFCLLRRRCWRKLISGYRLDLTNQRFGKLTAVSRAENQNGKTTWLCICDCGKTKIVKTHLLTQGRVHHCGCEANHVRHAKKHLDLTGKRFGRLIALEKTEKRDKKVLCFGYANAIAAIPLK